MSSGGHYSCPNPECRECSVLGEYLAAPPHPSPTAEDAPAAQHAIVAGSLVAPEPPPTSGSGDPIWGMVVKDMLERDLEGWRKYGVPLRAFDGRRSLVDAYQEVLDLAVYLRKEIAERSGGLLCKETMLVVDDKHGRWYTITIHDMQGVLAPVAGRPGRTERRARGFAHQAFAEALLKDPVVAATEGDTA